MPADVIADARARRSGRESQLAAHLARVDRELAALERERARRAQPIATRVAARAAARCSTREARLTEREAVLKRRLDDKLNEQLREARDGDRPRSSARLEADRPDTLVAAGRAARSAAVLSTGDIGGLRADARAALGAIGSDARAPAPTGDRRTIAASTRPPEIGRRVFVTTFGAEGIVRGVSGKHVDVEVRGKRMRVALDGPAARTAERRRLERGASTAAPPARSSRASSRPRDAGAPRANSCSSARPSTRPSIARRSSWTMRCWPTSGGCASSTATAPAGCATR